MNEWRVKRRILVCAFFLLAAVCGLAVRLGFLHLSTPRAKIDSLGDRRKIKAELIAGRGYICDRGGRRNTLALNLAAWDVCVDGKAAVKGNRVPDLAAELATVLAMPADAVAVRVNDPCNQHVRLRRFAPEELKERLEARDLAEVYFEETTLRYYPHGSLMCHVLGFANYQGVGSAGVEQSRNRFLKGCPGILEGRADAFRREIPDKRDRRVPPVSGANVRLALDQDIQYFVESALDDAIREREARAAWCIVQRVDSGEILAMASRPGYDLNSFCTSSEDARLNRAIGVVYEPGSTLKALTVAAAIDAGVLTPSTVIDCERGQWWHKGRWLRDVHPYGKLSVADVLKKSSNIGTAKIALMLGDKRLDRYLRQFGMGSRMNIDLPGEEAGILHPVDEWSGISCSRIAIGQGVAVTALQVLGAYCAVANGGRLMRPRVVCDVRKEDGTELLQTSSHELGRPVSPGTAATMCRLLNRVTEDGGTGTRGRVDGYEVSAKTGTAQKPEKGGYSSTAHIASFVGFLPSEAPKIGIIVVVDEPKGVQYGGVVAAPVFSRIAGETVRYLRVPPSHRTVLAWR
ncbi:peptidoglycan D,D-transpeptidase FtsI family protein [Verrucomicrobiota bacterium]